MKLSKTKKSPSQRLTFPSNMKMSLNNSFSLCGLNKIDNSKSDQYKNNHKNQSQSQFSGHKQKSKSKKFTFNDKINAKKERSSSRIKSLNTGSKISISKIEENQQQKYIFNSFKNQSLKSVSLKNKKNQSQLSVIKSIGKKQTKGKELNNPLLNVKNRFSVNENGKLKKKKITQSTNMNKTLFQERGSTTVLFNKKSKGFGERFSAKLCFEGQKQNKRSYKISSSRLQKQFQKPHQIQQIQTLNSLNLQNVRAQYASLYEALQPKQRHDLTCITKGYETVLAELSLLLSKNSNLKSKSTENGNSFNPNQQQTISEIHDKNYSCTDTQSQTNPSTPGNSPKKVTKLYNLQKLRHSFSIKSYHEEFMSNKQEFSDSWKRQLKKQKQF